MGLAASPCSVTSERMTSAILPADPHPIPQLNSQLCVPLCKVQAWGASKNLS